MERSRNAPDLLSLILYAKNTDLSIVFYKKMKKQLKGQIEIEELLRENDDVEEKKFENYRNSTRRRFGDQRDRRNFWRIKNEIGEVVGTEP